MELNGQIHNIDKCIGGVHSSAKDSVYLHWGANTTYAINW